MSCSFQDFIPDFALKDAKLHFEFLLQYCAVKACGYWKGLNQEDSISDTEDRARFKDPSEFRVAQ